MCGARSYTPYIGIEYLSPLYQRMLSLLELQVLVFVFALEHCSPAQEAALPVPVPVPAAPLAIRAPRAAARGSADERRGARVGRAARVRHLSAGINAHAPAARVGRALLADGERTSGGGAARAVARLEPPAGAPCACAMSSRLASETLVLKG